VSGPPPEVKAAPNLAALQLAEHAWDVFACVRSVKEFKTKDGRPFLILEITDAHRAWEAKIWDDAKEAQEVALRLTHRTVVKLRGHVKKYEGRSQLVVVKLRPVDPELAPEYDPAQLFDPALEQVEDLVAATLVFDIETVPGVDRRELPPTVHEALTQYAERKDMDPDKAMGLSPYFGKVVSLAVADGEAGGGQEDVHVLFAPPDGVVIPDPPPWLRPMSEPDLLRAFWALAGKAQVVVSFNGRGFDVPFLVARSLVHGIPARVDLMSQRFSLQPHLDLWELLGRDRGPSKLDVICWALGIDSPKEQMDGSMVAPAYAQGEYVKIAHYNAHDVRATCAVYRKARDLVLRYRSDWSR
jgi:hypothetical protein